jgi:hypothetical protein
MDGSALKRSRPFDGAGDASYGGLSAMGGPPLAPTCTVRAHRELASKLGLAEALREHDAVTAEREREELEGEVARLRAQLEALTGQLEASVAGPAGGGPAASSAADTASIRTLTAALSAARAETAAAKTDAAAAVRAAAAANAARTDAATASAAAIAKLEGANAALNAKATALDRVMTGLRAQLLGAGLTPGDGAGESEARADRGQPSLTFGSFGAPTGQWGEEEGGVPALSFGGWGAPSPARAPVAPASTLPPGSSIESALATAREEQRAAERRARAAEAALVSARAELERGNTPLLLERVAAAESRLARADGTGAEVGVLRSRLSSALGALAVWEERVSGPLGAGGRCWGEGEEVDTAVSRATSSAAIVAASFIDLQTSLRASRTGQAATASRLTVALAARDDALARLTAARAEAVAARALAATSAGRAEASSAKVAVLEARASRLAELVRAAEGGDKAGAALASSLAAAHQAVAAVAASGGPGKGAANRTAQLASSYEQQVGAAGAAVTAATTRVSDLTRLLDVAAAREASLVNLLNAGTVAHPFVAAAHSAHVRALEADLAAAGAELAALYGGLASAGGDAASPPLDSLESEESGLRVLPSGPVFAPAGARILHLSVNPSSAAYGAWEAKGRAALESMRGEVGAARAALVALTARTVAAAVTGAMAGAGEEGEGGSGTTLETASTAPPPYSSVAEIEDKEKYRKRVGEIFTAKARQVRDGVQALTGWGVDMAEGAEGGGALIFTLRSLYAEAEGDELRIRMDAGGEISVLDTAYAARLPAAGVQVLQVTGSFPAFLAHLIMEGASSSTVQA